MITTRLPPHDPRAGELTAGEAQSGDPGHGYRRISGWQYGLRVLAVGRDDPAAGVTHWSVVTLLLGVIPLASTQFTAKLRRPSRRTRPRRNLRARPPSP